MSTGTLERIKPLVTNDFESPSTGLRFSASCFGDIDWSLAKLYTTNDAYDSAYARSLYEALRCTGARRTFAPTPVNANGRIGRINELSKRIPLGDDIDLFRNREAPMEGTFLEARHDAGIFSAGGCGVIVMAYRNRLLFAHASREALLDRTWVLTGGMSRERKHVSVVSYMLEALAVKAAEDLSLVHVWPLYFIRPEHFGHLLDDPDEKHREYNEAARGFLPQILGATCGKATVDGIWLDLPGITRTQCTHAGIPSSNIHMEEHRYLDSKLPTTRNHVERTRRYLDVIVRHSP